MTSFLSKLRYRALALCCAFGWLAYANLTRREHLYRAMLVRRVSQSRFADIRQIAAVTGLIHGRASRDAGLLVRIATAREDRGELLRLHNRHLLACAEAACWLQDFALFDRLRHAIQSRETSAATRHHLTILDAVVGVGTSRLKVADFAATVPTSESARLFFPQLVHVLWASYFEQCGRRGEAREAYEHAMATMTRADPHFATIDARRRYITTYCRP